MTKVGLWTAHTAGNCVRQITCNPKHGIDFDEQANIIPLMIELHKSIHVKRKIDRFTKEG